MVQQWTPIREGRLAVAVCQFNAKFDHHLQLELGELVEIEEACGDWYRGYSLKNKNAWGIFPSSYVHLKDINMERTESSLRDKKKELPIIEEVTSVLREWGTIWKELFVKREVELFHNVRQLMMELMNWRRQIISGTLTADQVQQLKIQIANRIDYGNKMLGLDLIVRDKTGNVINLEETGVIELYKRHLESAQRSQTDPEGKKARNTSSSMAAYSSHNLYVNVKHVVCKIGDDSEVNIGLYDGRDNVFISEHFVVKWDKLGMPKDLEKLHNLSCLFTDLGSQDLQRNKLFLVCQIIRTGRMIVKDTDSKRLTQRLRRPFGIAVLYVSDIIQGNVEDYEDKEYFLQLHQCTGDEFLDTLIRKTVAREQDKQSSDQGIWISLQMLHGETNSVREDHPSLVNKFTAIARKHGFPDVIFPGDTRNDIYITLMSGNFERGNKSANKNIQVTLAVHAADGTKLENVFSTGAGQEMASEYYSCIYYHCASPKWMETVKLSVPIDRIQGAHIRFTFKHRATNDEKDKGTKISAFSYLLLMNNDGTALQDSEYDLAVYKCETRKIDNNTSYLKLPSKRMTAMATLPNQKKTPTAGGFTYSKNESFQISFQLCSTKLAQNVDLLGLLKWRSQKDKLPSILTALVKVSGEEIVKFLQDVFDALFAILMDNPEKYGELISDAVVFSIGLLADKKYHQFRPVLDTYIKNMFSAAKAYTTLTTVLQKHIELADNSERNIEDKRNRLIRYFKAAEYIVKFIVRSRQLSEMAAPGKGREDFEFLLNGLFSAVVKMMLNGSNDALLVQGCALKYVPAMFGDLLEVYDPAQLGFFARDLIERIQPGRLQTQKLTCIHQLVKSPLFSNPVARKIILPMVISQLIWYLERMEDLQICIDILNDLLTTLTKSPECVGETDENIKEIVVHLFRHIVGCVIRMDRSLALLGNYVACIICILDDTFMKDSHYQIFIESFNEEDLLHCLIELFLVFREFISTSVYSKDWLSMTMVQNQDILRAIGHFSNALYDKFLIGDSFELQLWNNYFQLAVAFITQEALQLEQFTKTKRAKILDKYCDMRLVVGKQVYDMWKCLGKNTVKLIPGIVGPFLEMTLVPEEDLRRATLPIFYDMIECEYRNRQNFRQVATEVISQLDVLVEGGKGDERYKELFQEIFTELFQGTRHNLDLCKAGLSFVDTITKLLTRLLDYRTVTETDDNINNKMSCTVNILYFYQGIKREEMYIRYLYKLCDLHLSVENFTEAAFTLLLHADLLQWNDQPLSSTHQVKYKGYTQRQLKEVLYKEIIEYYDKGKTWEYGIRLCKELAQQYETDTYDYVQLSQILEKQAKFFDNIIKSVMRGEPEYFRVGFYGKGFPPFLRNKTFIYRGNVFERLSDFIIRMETQFPSAQFIKTLTPPDKDITESSGQYFQICRVDPVPVERRRFRGKAVAEQIRKFYEVNDITQFALSRPFHKGKKDKDNEFSTLYIERTTMITHLSFPGILRWFEVANSQVSELTPVENALETMKAKNKEIQSMIGRFKADKKANLNPLSMLLNGVIDAAVMGGISNYEKAFLNEDYVAKNPEHKPYTDELKELIVDQVDLLEQGLALHKIRAAIEIRPFHEKMEKCFDDMKQKVAPYRKQLRAQSVYRPKSVVVTHFGGQQGRFRSDTELSSDTAPPVPIKHKGDQHQVKIRSSTAADRDRNNRHTTIIGGQALQQAMLGEENGQRKTISDATCQALKDFDVDLSPKLPPRPRMTPKQMANASSNSNLTSTPPPKPARISTFVSSPDDDVVSTEPPVLPEKKRIHSGQESEPKPDSTSNSTEEEESAPPVPPRQK
eukprot:gene5649-6345_t